MFPFPPRTASLPRGGAWSFSGLLCCLPAVGLYDSSQLVFFWNVQIPTPSPSPLTDLFRSISYRSRSKAPTLKQSSFLMLFSKQALVLCERFLRRHTHRSFRRRNVIPSSQCSRISYLRGLFMPCPMIDLIRRKALVRPPPSTPFSLRVACDVP